MTKTYAQLKSTIAKLEKEAEALREGEMRKVIAQIRESIATFGLTVEHLFGRGAKALKAVASKAVGAGKPARKGAGVPKYRDPKTGKTWTGFGKAPAWLATVRNRDKFLIDPSGAVAEPLVAKDVAPAAVAAKKAARKTRTVAAPVKKSPARKAAAKKSAPSRKAAPAEKVVTARKAAAKAPKGAAAKTVKSKAAAKGRRARTPANAAAPVVTAAMPDTAASAS